MSSMGWHSSIRWKRDNYYRIKLHYISHKYNIIILRSLLQCHLCRSSLKFDKLYRSIFISNPFLTTDPDVDVISGWGRQCYVEPWW